jgi:nickel transport protein
MIRLAACLALIAAPALAHDLRVFARVDGDTVIVEASFSSGRVPTAGEITLSNAAGAILGTVPLDDDGETAFTLPDAVRDTGMRIDVTVSEGHSDYWLLTPGDIAHGQE